MFFFPRVPCVFPWDASVTENKKRTDDLRPCHLRDTDRIEARRFGSALSFKGNEPRSREKNSGDGYPRLATTYSGISERLFKLIDWSNNQKINSIFLPCCAWCTGYTIYLFGIFPGTARRNANVKRWEFSWFGMGRWNFDSWLPFFWTRLIALGWMDLLGRDACLSKYDAR